MGQAGSIGFRRLWRVLQAVHARMTASLKANLLLNCPDRPRKGAVPEAVFGGSDDRNGLWLDPGSGVRACSS